ncbi:hypothetical protein [Streptomyces sp. NPDC059009]|uniref:hypothetical protein n=1 Tax=Streptomyces sp. NPDC059009 TaxID=3346694 RepID=UPI0036B3A8FE
MSRSMDGTGPAAGEGVPVRCPVCGRQHTYAPPAFPCACGAPVTPPMARGTVIAPVTDRSWSDEWVTVRCGACGRKDQWPQPELGCGCGAVLRIPVRLDSPKPAEPAEAAEAAEAAGTAEAAEAAETPEPAEPPGPPGPAAAPASPEPRKRFLSPRPRPAFEPMTIRTVRDAVTAVALYLRWLGFQDISGGSQRPPSGVRVCARGIVAQVEPSVRPASLRDVECVWLTGLTQDAECACFSLSGYADDARDRADELGVPLFVLDLTGTPQPVNGAADDLIGTSG